MRTIRHMVTLALVGGAFYAASACSSDPGASPGDPPGGATCANGVKDADEQGVDCGGNCQKCAGDPCADIGECRSGQCVDGKCAAPAGKPCGVGTATSCAEGQPCEQNGDCTTKTCTNAKCAPPAPGASNGVKDNGETDVDCGGPNAPACAAGKTCLGDDDCADKYCPDATPRVCVTPRNDDGVKNGSETDVDCGGQSGKKCDVGKACLVDGDCTAACNYAKKCVEATSCRPQFGGDTCGEGNYEDVGRKHESCCRSLPVPGYTAPNKPGKQVFLDKYEVTAGRFRAFIEEMQAKNGGNIKAWIAANTPPIWDPSWNLFMPTGNGGDAIVVPRQPSNPPEALPWNRNAGINYQFNSQLFIYVHGHTCDNVIVNGKGSYGTGTFWYPPNVMALNGGLTRGAPLSDEAPFPPLAVGATEQLDMKSMTCVPAAMLAAFCHWDGGQLATDEVLDFVTNAPANLGAAAGCGTRCAPIGSVQQSSDSGTDTGILYRYPFYNESSEGVFRIAPPGRVTGDVVRINAGDEPWMDLHGNLQEIVYDMTGATFTGNFMIKYRGIGYSSARAGGNATNPAKYTQPEYKAGYSGGRCMRFK